MHKPLCSVMDTAGMVATATTNSLYPTPGEVTSALLHLPNPFINRYLTIVL